ncbi:LapD/MoxY N-terminal periplasmic domain-containing protein, partial [Oleiphilus sp. HI0080]
MHKTIKKRSLKQLVLVSVGALVLFLVGLSASLNFANTRIYIDQQLARYSMDAATFLGLALSSQKDDESNVAKERMIDSIFDSGDYASIEFRAPDGRVVVQRALSSEDSGVPRWFLSRIKLSDFVGHAKVMSGWTQLGSVHVQANPALAEKELWSLFKSQFVLFLSVLSIGLSILYLLLRKLLSPLSQLEFQAHRIASRAFDQLIDPPATRELDAVVRSMNEMSVKLKRVFDEQLDDIERLRDQSRKDALTGLFNREG